MLKRRAKTNDKGSKKMKIKNKLMFAVLSVMASSTVFAAEMPNAIVVPGKAEVPITKTQIIRSMPGKEPIRTVETTKLEVTNKGKDVTAHQEKMMDNQGQFDSQKMDAPMIKEGSVIVPTSKIEESAKVMKDGKVVAETKHVDASGMEYKKGKRPVHKNLKVDQVKNPEHSKSATHAVMKKDGKTTKDVVVIKDKK